MSCFHAAADYCHIIDAIDIEIFHYAIITLADIISLGFDIISLSPLTDAIFADYFRFLRHFRFSFHFGFRH
jgi:hypothetical protein